jgi:hypothetical protein
MGFRIGWLRIVFGKRGVSFSVVKKVLLVGILVLGVSPAMAQNEPGWSTEETKVGKKEFEFTRYVPAGKTAQLRLLGLHDPSCVLSGEPAITKEPGHGTAKIEPIEGKFVFPKDAPNAGCNGKKLQNYVLIYKAEAGYLGTDTLEAATISPYGLMWQFRFIINVVKPSSKKNAER